LNGLRGLGGDYEAFSRRRDASGKSPAPNKTDKRLHECRGIWKKISRNRKRRKTLRLLTYSRPERAVIIARAFCRRIIVRLKWGGGGRVRYFDSKRRAYKSKTTHALKPLLFHRVGVSVRVSENETFLLRGPNKYRFGHAFNYNQFCSIVSSVRRLRFGRMGVNDFFSIFSAYDRKTNVDDQTFSKYAV